MLRNSWPNSSSHWAVAVITYLPIPCKHCTVVWSASQIILISYWLPLFVDVKSQVTALYAGINRLKMVLLDVFLINSRLLDRHLRSTRLWNCDLTSTTLCCRMKISLPPLPFLLAVLLVWCLWNRGKFHHLYDSTVEAKRSAIAKLAPIIVITKTIVSTKVPYYFCDTAI